MAMHKYYNNSLNNHYKQDMTVKHHAPAGAIGVRRERAHYGQQSRRLKILVTVNIHTECNSALCID